MVKESTAQTRGTLTRERILDTAIALADGEGIDAVSMRRVGRSLGVQAMSLYNHVEGKQDLLDGMAGRLLTGMDIPPAGAMDWKAAIRTVCRSYRQLAHGHPAIFPSIHARPLSSPESLPPLEGVLAILEREGFDADTALDAFLVAGNYTAGFALAEIGDNQGDRSRETFREHLPSMHLVASRYPVTAGVLAAASPDSDRAFELGLDFLVDGFDRRLRA